MTPRPSADGVALMCDVQGVIRHLLLDRLALCHPPATGEPFAALLLPECRGKADALFNAVRDQGAEFDWEFDAETPSGVVTLHVAASMVDSGVLVVAARSRSALVRLFREAVRREEQQPDLPTRLTSLRDAGHDDPFTELSRINNELVNAQRSLAKLHGEQRTLAEENGRLFEAERTARAAAESAVALQEQILASVSHDLRTPLTTIRGLTQMLHRRAGQQYPDAAWLLQGLSTLESSAAKMATMIEEILDAARLQSGQPLALRLAPTDLVALTRKIVATHQAMAPRHEIVVTATTSALTGQWDAVRLERVLDNLLSNAVKYSPDGGTVSVHLRLRDDHTPPCAELSVQDQGIGIPAADLPHIFEHLYRATNATGKIAGTGIGLAGVKRIIEQHGGDITLASTVDHGTTVTVLLPLTTTS